MRPSNPRIQVTMGSPDNERVTLAFTGPRILYEWLRVAKMRGTIDNAVWRVVIQGRTTLPDLGLISVTRELDKAAGQVVSAIPVVTAPDLREEERHSSLIRIKALLDEGWTIEDVADITR